MAKDSVIKAIPGYQYYYADKDGNIYSITPKNRKAFFDLATMKINAIPGKPGKYFNHAAGEITVKQLKPQPNSLGYLRVYLYMNGKRKRAFVHRLILLTFKGPFPKDKITNHKDLDYTNNRLKNLEFMTQAENIQHSYDNRPRRDITKSMPGDPF